MKRIDKTGMLISGALLLAAGVSVAFAAGWNNNSAAEKDGQDVAAAAAPMASHPGASAADPVSSPEAEADSPFPAPAEPSAQDGLPLTQLGLDGWRYWSVEEPFLNLLRLTGNDWTAGQNWPGSETMSMAEMLAGGYIDPETMLPKAIPPGFDYVRSGLFRYGARLDAAAWAGDYVAEWEGEADAVIGLGCAAGQKRAGPSRIEFSCPEDDRSWTNIRFTRIGAGGVRAVRVYRAENEALVKAGEVFDPRFLAYAGRYKILRTLDIQSPNAAGARSVDHLGKMRHAQWGASPAVPRGGIGPARLPMGPPMKALFDMAVKADAALWLHVAGMIGAPAVFDETEPSAGPRRKETRSLARQHAEEILNSPEWPKYADAMVAALKASGYPETRALYIETGNEAWNNAHPFWQRRDYFHGIRDWANEKSPVAGYGSMVGAGFMQAHFAVHLKAALERAGRKQAAVFVLACQHANPATCEGVIAGYKHYFAMHDIDPAPFLARAGLSTATYFHEGLGTRGLFASDSAAETADRWRAAIAEDPEGAAKALTDWYLTADQCCTIPYLVRMRDVQQKIAEDAGIAFIGDYEGESHDAAIRELRDNPDFQKWYFDVWNDGPQGERLTRAWLEALYAQNPDAIIANYKGVAPRQIAHPWGDGLYGEETGRRRAMEGFLRGQDVK